MPRIPVGGPRLWVEVTGTGAPMVLLPGGPGLASDYVEPVGRLADDRMIVVRIDPRGCGQSDRGESYEVADLIGDLEALRQALGHERWVVVGHSFGADLALAYALEHPQQTDAVVAISGTGLQDDRAWHAAYEAGRAAGRDEAPPTHHPVDDKVHADGLASWRRYIKEQLLLRRVSDLTVPYLAVVGSEDVRPAWPVAQVAALAPHGRFAVIDGAAHIPWLTHAAELRSIMHAFLSR